jgi:hypothetical protein
MNKKELRQEMESSSSSSLRDLWTFVFRLIAGITFVAAAIGWVLGLILQGFGAIGVDKLLDQAPVWLQITIGVCMASYFFWEIYLLLTSPTSAELSSHNCSERSSSE